MYRLRSYLFCALCGGRMLGKSVRNTPYYVCSPKKGYNPPGHPAISSFWIREEALLAGLGGFRAERVFGRYRHDLLGAHLDGVAAARQEERDRRLVALRTALTETESRRQRRLLTTLETRDGPTGAVFSRVQQRIADALGSAGKTVVRSTTSGVRGPPPGQISRPRQSRSEIGEHDKPARAPGGIRTHTVGGLSTVSLPLEYRGRQSRSADAGS